MICVTLEEIIEYLDENHIPYSVEGSRKGIVKGYASFYSYEEGCMTWIRSPKETHRPEKPVALCIAPQKLDMEVETWLLTDKPKMVFFELLNHFYHGKEIPTICTDSVVEAKHVGKHVSIGHHCYIGPDVVIGNNVIIKNNVSIECPTVIEDNVTLWSGVVIGTDGFGYYEDLNGKQKKVPHFGGVHIGRDTEIGANTCIDRGTMSDTYIGRNVKIDDLCHIAHNVRVGDNTLITSGSIMGGSSELKENVYLGTGSAIRNQVTIGSNSFVGMGSVVMKNVEDETAVVGNPARKGII